MQYYLLFACSSFSQCCLNKFELSFGTLMTKKNRERLKIIIYIVPKIISKIAFNQHYQYNELANSHTQTHPYSFLLSVMFGAKNNNPKKSFLKIKFIYLFVFLLHLIEPNFNLLKFLKKN